MSFNIRLARPEDAEACGAICFAAFSGIAKQHNFPPDLTNVEEPIGLLTHLISRDDVYTVVAELDGKLVGSNVLWENGEIAGIGPISVDPTVQHGSVGRSLMENVLERAKAQGFERVRLVQAAFNNLSMALYNKLGFDVQEPLSVLNGPALNISIPGYIVRVANSEDESACNQLSMKLHGHQRSGDLADAIKQKAATVVEREGRITGYTAVIGFWGHSIAESNEDMKALIGAAPALGGPGILLPTRNAELMRWCLNNGLKVIQPMSLMSYGAYTEPKGAFLPSVLF
jgi:predicted N-acetyltransferase YhbS